MIEPDPYMPNESELKAEIGRALLIDIVSYSKNLINPAPTDQASLARASAISGKRRGASDPR